MAISANQPTTRYRAPRVPMPYKILSICSHIESFQLNPKSFLTEFLQHSSINAAFWRRFWGTVGWPSTRRLLMNIKSLVCNNSDGQDRWEQFILEEATRILLVAKLQANDKPPAKIDNGDEEPVLNKADEQQASEPISIPHGAPVAPGYDAIFSPENNGNPLPEIPVAISLHQTSQLAGNSPESPPVPAN
ncbi:hypothetical protein PCANC_08986 [Puccinia coronata f. sp. avenae]|uniref:Uncharacterized protein n=1 Tax=Puccinia coronata f. sp. avenae TaxID=200324 RepID=A0A2N5VHU6_9BASI|nr:hypothetical protein PCANC_08986 [Puccinia coronata f. sp. avenae]